MDEFQQERLEQIRSNVIKVDDPCYPVRLEEVIKKMTAKEFEQCTRDSFSKILHSILFERKLYLYSALGKHGDVPETTFLRFHIADYLDSFDSETDYIGLMISNVKFRNKWFHDARRHKYIRLRNSNVRRRNKRNARKSENLWDRWRKPNRRPNYSKSTTSTTTSTTTPTTFPTINSATSLKTTLTTASTTTFTTTSTTTSTSTSTTTFRPNQAKNPFRKVQIEPGTIVMMNSTYLHDKYISTGRATTFHRALLMDYFGLSESDMERMGMTVVAWGFSYQVVDKKFPGRKVGQAEKFFCDFKFRSFTFNAGYVGAKVNIEFGQYQG